MAADLRALRASPAAQALGLAVLSVLFSAGLLHLGLGRDVPGPVLVVVLLLACGSMLAAFVRVATRRSPSRLRGVLVGAAAYVLFGLLYGLLRYAITQERAFLIGMSSYMWPWLLVWDAGCPLGLWHCMSLGN